MNIRSAVALVADTKSVYGLPSKCPNEIYTIGLSADKMLLGGQFGQVLGQQHLFREGQFRPQNPRQEARGHGRRPHPLAPIEKDGGDRAVANLAALVLEDCLVNFGR